MTRSDQTMPSRLFIFCLLLSALLFLCRPSAEGQPTPPQNPRSIIVVSDDDYPPYIFRDAKGDLRGILVDEWGLWENKTGIKVDLRGMDWGKAQKFMAEGKADVIDTIFFTDEQAKQYDFSKPYATLEVPIFFHKNISGITDSNSLHGFVVGVKDGDACIDMLQRIGISTLRIMSISCRPRLTGTSAYSVWTNLRPFIICTSSTSIMSTVNPGLSIQVSSIVR